MNRGYSIVLLSALFFIFFPAVTQEPPMSLRRTANLYLPSTRKAIEYSAKAAPVVSALYPGMVSRALLGCVPNNSSTETTREVLRYLLPPCFFVGSVYALMHYSLGISSVADLRNKCASFANLLHQRFGAVEKQMRRDLSGIEQKVGELSKRVSNDQRTFEAAGDKLSKDGQTFVGQTEGLVQETRAQGACLDSVMRAGQVLVLIRQDVAEQGERIEQHQRGQEAFESEEEQRARAVQYALAQRGGETGERMVQHRNSADQRANATKTLLLQTATALATLHNNINDTHKRASNHTAAMGRQNENAEKLCGDAQRSLEEARQDNQQLLAIYQQHNISLPNSSDSTPARSVSSSAWNSAASSRSPSPSRK